MEGKETADSLKNKGNDYYHKKDYDNAIDCYSRSLDILKTAACYSNRSLCFIQLKRYTKAAADATAAIRCDPLFAKAWLRRGICGIQTKSFQRAYYDLLRANELNPNSKDILKQLDICSKEEGVTTDTLDEHIQSILEEMRQGFDSGNSNEAVSYVQDILEYRPFDKEVLDQLARLLEERKCWKEALVVLDKLIQLTKEDEAASLEYLLRHVYMDLEHGELKAAKKDITYYNNHVSKEKQQLDLAKRIEEELNGESKVERALSMVSERMDIPKVPDSLYELVYQLQVFKDQHTLLHRYLLNITPEKIGDLFKDSDTDVEPYELLLQQMAEILRKNISHCYWVMDSLRAIKECSSFGFVRTMLPDGVMKDVEEMKVLIQKNGKVSEELLSVFDEYLYSSVFY